MTSDEQAIRKLVATWLSASAAGDTQTVLSLMADDVVFLVPGQPPMRGKAAFAAGQSALNQLRIQATSDIQEIRVFGDWANCWTTLTVVVTPTTGGASVTRAGNTLSILRKQSDGAWVLFRDANMLAVVPGDSQPQSKILEPPRRHGGQKHGSFRGEMPTTLTAP